MLKELIFDKIQAFVAKAGADYGRHWEAENAKVRQQAKDQQALNLQQDLFVFYQQYYFLIADLLAQAVDATEGVTSIIPIRNPNQLAVSSINPAQITKGGYPALIYKAWLKRKHAHTANQLGRILEDEINNLTGFCNLPRLIVRVRIQPNGQIWIGVAFWDDWARSIKI